MKYYIIFICFFIQQSIVYAESDDVIFQQLLHNHGQALQQGKNDNKALLSGLRMLSSKNHKESQYMLGVLGLTGLVEPKELIKNLHQSESNGCAGAAGIIATLYMKGEFVPKNEQIALGWVQNTAERGDFSSQMLLGGMYSEGTKLVKIDKIISYSWLYQASLIEKPAALPIKVILISLNQKLSPQEIKTAKNLANQRLEESGGIQKYFCAHSTPI